VVLRFNFRGVGLSAGTRINKKARHIVALLL
jgi:hypothetical protein